MTNSDFSEELLVLFQIFLILNLIYIPDFNNKKKSRFVKVKGQGPRLTSSLTPALSHRTNSLRWAVRLGAVGCGGRSAFPCSDDVRGVAGSVGRDGNYRPS